MGVLRASLQRCELTLPETVAYYCTVTMSRRVWPHLPDHKLSTVSRHCGIELVHHEAASDAAACASIALSCLGEVGMPNLDDLADELGLRAGIL